MSTDPIHETAQALSILDKQAQAGAALYWSMYYAKPEIVTGLPDRVVEAFALAQSVFGTHRKPWVRVGDEERPTPETAPVDPDPGRPYLNPGDDTVNGSWATP